jgi:hypothetical protein
MFGSGFLVLMQQLGFLLNDFDGGFLLFDLTSVYRLGAMLGPGTSPSSVTAYKPWACF